MKEEIAEKEGEDLNTNALFPQPPRLAGEDMQRFWEGLPNARLQDNELSMPEGVFWLGDPRLGSRLYVRPEVYYALFDQIIASKCGQGGGPFVVSGTPGIGKSFFLLYALWRLRTDNRPPRSIMFEQQTDLLKETAFLEFKFDPGWPVRMGTADQFLKSLRDSRSW